MDKQISKAVVDVVSALDGKVYSAAKYLSPKLVVRATKKRFKGKLPAKYENPEITLVIGRPNYEQREFIKSCKKAEEPFPVKKIQIKSVK